MGVPVTVPDCKTGSVTKIVPEKQGGGGRDGREGRVNQCLGR